MLFGSFFQYIARSTPEAWHHFIDNTDQFHELCTAHGPTCDLTINGVLSLTLKAPITTAADDIHKYFFIVFQRK